MSSAVLEHVNISVTDPEKTAALMCELFNWSIRWKGPSKLSGFTIHVGSEDSYLALYTPNRDTKGAGFDGATVGNLNHVGVVVSNLDAVEKKVMAAGYKTHNHGDYEPGRRFYFNDDDGVEYEVVSYA